MLLPFTEEEMWLAWERVQENEGCAGCDGVTVEQFARRAAIELRRVAERVAQNLYQPFPLLKIIVEKRPGSTATRTLLVPTVRDRVLQTAAARMLSRSFEEEFLECSYGYRPGRSVDRAIARIRKCRELGYHFVVDADIQTFFDRVDHALLLDRLRTREPGPVLTGLLDMWVHAQVWNGERVRRLEHGIPQGSPVSPLLANFFLEDFDRELEKSGRKLVRYADDFLVLARTREEAEQSLVQTEAVLADAHLTLNREKTRIVSFDEGFHFLGALFQGDTIWVPWKQERRKGRLIFMARPLPLSLRTRYELLAPPRGTLELALDRSGIRASEMKPRSGTAIPRSQPVAFLYVTEQGAVLRKSGDRFLIEKDDEIILDLPYHKLETVLLFGNIQVTTQALAELLEKGVNLSLFSRQGQYRGSLTPPRGRNIDLRVAQFDCYRNGERAMAMARAVVAAKISNGVAVVNRYREANTVPDWFEGRRGALSASIAAAGEASDIATLDGVEGAAARMYFELLMTFNKSEMTWPGRQKHPSKDPLNALLSLVYSLLMHELTALLEGVGLDPYLGFLHQVDYGRPSLALDLVEAFRHAVADRLVLHLVNRRIVEADDFQAAGEHGGVFLGPKAFQRFLGAYEAWMLARGLEAPDKKGGGGTGPRFRDALRGDVESLARALRSGGVFAPYRFDQGVQEDAGCSTSSVTI